MVFSFRKMPVYDDQTGYRATYLAYQGLPLVLFLGNKIAVRLENFQMNAI